MSALLEITALGKDFGGLTAMDGISFQMERGESVGVIGPNGAGKTTLLNCISGLLRADRGAVSVLGQPTTRLAPHRIARLGLARTLQLAEHFNDFRVDDFVMIGRQQRLANSVWTTGIGLPHVRRREQEQRRIAHEFLERFDLADSKHRKLRELSYGAQRLADLARAAASEPRLLLLDEPTSGSSESDREVLAGHLADFRRDGIGVLVVDHDVAFVSATCDRALAMALGRTLAQGSPAAVLAHPEVIEAYLGRPA
jgi:branched-chain amino acid transport system ATP-binding protein